MSGTDETLPATPTDAEPGDDYPQMVRVDPQHYVMKDEIARGGMGRIRIARDRRLGRRIALKEILTHRPDVARRFEREARITARLEHPAIVSVHEAGAWPTGEPFIAMRLVNGRSLDEVIAGARTLPERMALLPNVLAIADAVAYAHEQGVIHRDLKPKNVLVGKFGETVVIDWGLAKDRDDDAADDELPLPATAPPVPGTEDTLAPPSPPSPPSATAETLTSDLPTQPRGGTNALTIAGSVMGTPAYMPPEQAVGDPVDERADVYAIGAILYHVLAGEPPIAGKTVAEMLANVVGGNVVPLAERAPDAPVDLLAIVDKAMARQPADRYPTAAELADDLRRFQTGQLVGAHRYSVGELIRKWVRKHRAVLGIAAIAFGVLAVLAVVSVSRILAERERADAQRALAERNRAESEGLVTFMTDELFKQLELVGRLDLMEPITKRVITHYAATEGLPDREAKHAKALVQRAAVLEAQGKLALAIDEVKAALAIRKARLDAHPHDLQAARDLANGYHKLSDMLRRQGHLDASLDIARSALAIVETVVARDPANLEVQRDLAGVHKRIGDVLRAKSDAPNALAAYRRALAIRETVARAKPADLEWQRDLAIMHERIGTFLRDQKDHDGALAELRKALAIAEPAVKADPAQSRERRRDISVLQTRIGDVLFAKGDLDGALAAYRESKKIPEQLAAEQPRNPTFQRDLSVNHSNIGRVLLAKGDRDGALAELRADLQIAQRLARQDPTNAAWQRDLSVSHEQVGDLLLEGGDTAGALAEYRASLVIAKALAEQDPTNTPYRVDLAATYDKLATIHERRGEVREAAAMKAAAAKLR